MFDVLTIIGSTVILIAWVVVRAIEREEISQLYDEDSSGDTE